VGRHDDPFKPASRHNDVNAEAQNCRELSRNRHRSGDFQTWIRNELVRERLMAMLSAACRKASQTRYRPRSDLQPWRLRIHNGIGNYKESRENLQEFY
jgi:hypothetical protein